MRKKGTQMLAALLYYSGLVPLLVLCQRLMGPRLIILNYHRALGQQLHKHLLYLRRYYRVLPFEEAVEELYAPVRTRRKDRRTLLTITFDDGYRDNYTRAFRLACALQMPITLFLPTGYIGSGKNFWWLEGERLARHAQVAQVTLEGTVYRPGDAHGRGAFVHMMDTRLRRAPSVGERETFLAAMLRDLAIPAEGACDDEAALPISWEQVLEMEQSGWVKFGAHTVNHPVLACLSQPGEVLREVCDCRAVIEEKLGHAVNFFAYPIGKPEDIGETAIGAVKEAGYRWAVTTISGANTATRDPYRLRRFSSDTADHWLLQAASISGIWKFISPNWRKTYRARE